MCGVDRIEAIFGDCAFYAASGAVIEEDCAGREDCSGNAIGGHDRKDEDCLTDCL